MQFCRENCLGSDGGVDVGVVVGGVLGFFAAASGGGAGFASLLTSDCKSDLVTGVGSPMPGAQVVTRVVTVVVAPMPGAQVTTTTTNPSPRTQHHSSLL